MHSLLHPAYARALQAEAIARSVQPRPERHMRPRRNAARRVRLSLRPGAVAADGEKFRVDPRSEPDRAV
jgi:hypothetical protein